LKNKNTYNSRKLFCFSYKRKSISNIKFRIKLL